MNAYSKFKVVPFVTQSTLPEVSCIILKCQELFLDQLAPNHQGWAPRPAKKGLPRPAPPRENWQNLRGGAGQSLFESLEN